MVSAEMITRIEEESVVLDPLNSRASRQVDDILEQYPEPVEDQPAERVVWHYRVPFAGVRYYSY